MLSAGSDHGKLLSLVNQCLLRGVSDSVAAVYGAALHLCASVFDVHVKPDSHGATTSSGSGGGGDSPVPNHGIDSDGRARFGVHALKLSTLLHEVKIVYPVILAR